MAITTDPATLTLDPEREGKLANIKPNSDPKPNEANEQTKPTASVTKNPNGLKT